MPTFPFEDDGSQTSLLNYWRLISMMLFFDDTKLHNCFMTHKIMWFTSEMLKKIDRQVADITRKMSDIQLLDRWLGPNALYDAIYGPGEQEIKKLAEKRTNDALIAGAILFQVKLLDGFGKDAASINNVIKIMSKFGKGLEPVGGEKLVSLSCSERKLRSAWSKYKPVSHLWATPWFLDAHISDFCSVEKFIFSDFQTFVDCSEALRTWAEVHVHKHGEKKPLLLPEETWKLPDWFQINPVEFDYNP